MRRWKTVNNGGIVFENVQTGDGRVWTDGAWSWENPADVPLQWNPDDNSSHEGTLTFGNADRIERVDNRIEAEGPFDDSLPRADELVQRMEQGLASGVSVVYDDVTVEIVDNSGTSPDGAEESVVVMASATLRLDHRGTTVVNAPPHIARLLTRNGGVLLAAAGDPAPDAGDVLFEDSSDSLIYRYTRSRLRAITLVDVPAFVDARIELGASEAAPAEPVIASASFPLAPPRSWLFMPEPDDSSDLWVLQPDGQSWAVPLTILDSGQFYGHACYFGQCHIGYLDDCVSPPLSSDEFLARARVLDEHGDVKTHGALTGVLRVDDGTDVPVMPVVLSADHPDGWMFSADAQDEYAHTGLQWGQCRVTQSPIGVWVAGALNPDITPEQLRVLRASALSGDWREVPGEQGAQFVAVLTVSRPGFPIARHALAASGLTVAAPQPFVQYDEQGRVLRASALNVVHAACPECEQRQRLGGSLTAANARSDDEVLRILNVLERRTRSLGKEAMTAALSRMVDQAQIDEDHYLEAWRSLRGDLAS